MPWNTKNKFEITCPKFYSIFLHYSKDRKCHHLFQEKKVGAVPQGLLFLLTSQQCCQPALVFPEGIQLLFYPAQENAPTLLLQRHSPTAPPAQRGTSRTCPGPYRNFYAMYTPLLDFNTKVGKQILTAVWESIIAVSSGGLDVLHILFICITLLHQIKTAS